MAKAPETETDSTDTNPLSAMAKLQEAGFGDMVGLGTAWFEVLGDMSAEFVGFVADRIKEDVKVQHQIMHCKDVSEIQQIQSEFIQKAMDQYRAETGKLVEIGASALSPNSDK